MIFNTKYLVIVNIFREKERKYFQRKRLSEREREREIVREIVRERERERERGFCYF